MNSTPHKPRLLIAEDNGSIRDVLAILLAVEGFDAVFAINGAQALKAFQDAESAGRAFDLCIFDRQMPVLGGFEAACLVRCESAHVPIVFLTAAPHEVTPEMMQEVGAVALWAKPNDVVGMAVLIREVLASAEKDS
jgi:CheY-like chemotaxis protein